MYLTGSGVLIIYRVDLSLGSVTLTVNDTLGRFRYATFVGSRTKRSVLNGRF